MSKQRQKINNLQDLKNWVKSQSSQLKTPCVVLLDGPLGVGKTQAVKFFVNELGVSEEAYSPTYSLINEYVGKTCHIYHVDLYRLEGSEDLNSTGFWDLFDNEDVIIFIEWADRLPEEQLPFNWLKFKVHLRPGLVEWEKGT